MFKENIKEYERRVKVGHLSITVTIRCADAQGHGRAVVVGSDGDNRRRRRRAGRISRGSRIDLAFGSLSPGFDSLAYSPGRWQAQDSPHPHLGPFLLSSRHGVVSASSPVSFVRSLFFPCFLWCTLLSGTLYIDLFPACRPADPSRQHARVGGREIERQGMQRTFCIRPVASPV